MTMNENRHKIEIKDALIAAYLDMQGLHVRTRAVDKSKVVFEVTGEDVDDEMDHFYQNPKVPLLSYLTSYKKIKSMLYTAKGSSA